MPTSSWFIPSLLIIAVLSYLIGSLNPSIIMSRLLYKEDIRTKGSGNPGFTNFKRVYGNHFSSYFVLFLDSAKTLLPVLLSGFLLGHFFGSPSTVNSSFLYTTDYIYQLGC